MSYLIPNFTSGYNRGGQNVEPFPDPFCDYASTAMPSSMENALRWCEYIMLANGVYRSAIDRVIAYHITEVEIEGTDRDGKEKYKDYLADTLGIYKALPEIALDYCTYGNFFGSLIMPFRRNLSCPQCGFEAPLNRIHDNPNFSYKWSGAEFNASCPFCKYSGKWTHIDRRSHEEDDLLIKRWSPHEMELMWDPYTDQVGHIWRIPNHYKQNINKGTLFHLERAPWEVVQAVKNGTHIEFNKDVIYHGKEDTLAGVLNRGWGVSRVLTNFRQAWYVQVLHRYNEAIGLDYIIPFRVITPEPRPGGAGGGGEETDPLFTADLGGFTGQVNAMLRQRRRDPTMWFTLPFPLRYQSLGAEASQLAPHELLTQGLDTLLSSVGVPIQFYKGDLSVQSAPAALRLMESHWSHLTYVLNGFLQWLCNKISVALSWDEVTVRLAKPSHADDLNRQLAKLQLMMSQQVSQTTGLKSVGLVFEDEQKRILEEQRFVAEEAQKAQEEIEAAGLGDQMAAGAMGPAGGDPAAMGGMPGPGAGGMVPPAQPGAAGAAAAPPAGGGQAPTPEQAAMPMDPVQAVMAQLPMGNEQGLTPPELDAIAQTVAQQIYGLPPGQRQSALRQLKQRSPTIHSLVKSLLEQMDSQAEARGREMMSQQAQMGQQGSMAQPPM